MHFCVLLIAAGTRCEFIHLSPDYLLSASASGIGVNFFIYHLIISSQHQLRDCTWLDVVKRLKEAQQDVMINIRKQDLTELGVFCVCVCVCVCMCECVCVCVCVYVCIYPCLVYYLAKYCTSSLERIG